MHSPIADLIARLNLARAQRIKSFIFINIKNVNVFLSKLVELGVIRGFTVLGSFVEVFMKYVNGKIPFVKILFVGGLTNRYMVSYYKLLHISDRAGSSVFIVSTKQGYRFNSECIIDRIGGYIVARIDL